MTRAPSRLVSSIRSSASLISKAVRENQDGKYVYVLTENNTVDVRVVEVGTTVDDDVAIISGLNKGDKVITTDGTFELGESVKL